MLVELSTMPSADLDRLAKMKEREHSRALKLKAEAEKARLAENRRKMLERQIATRRAFLVGESILEIWPELTMEHRRVIAAAVALRKSPPKDWDKLSDILSLVPRPAPAPMSSPNLTEFPMVEPEPNRTSGPSASSLFRRAQGSS